MVWIHAITEVDSVVMNPMAPDKFLRLARQLELEPGSRVLDVGAGRCGAALLLVREFGCSVTAVEPFGDFLDEGRRRVEAAGLTHRFEFVQKTGADFHIEPESYDAAICLGATWAWDGLGGTLDALKAGVREEGHVLAGEPYKHRSEDETEHELHPWTLPEVIERFEERGLAVMWMVRSSVHEWDEYTSVHARDLLDWLAANPGHPDSEEVRGWRRDQVRRLGGPYIGWAIIAGRKTANA